MKDYFCNITDILSRHLHLEPEPLPVFFRHQGLQDAFAQIALPALFALAGQQLVRHFVQGDPLQGFRGRHAVGEPNRAGDHQLRQEHIVVFRKVGVHAPEGVIPFGVAARDFVNVHVGIKMLLPPGQDPVGPEQVRDAVLATAEEARVAPQRNGKVVADGVGAAHKAAFVDEAFQFVPRLVHLF